MYDLLAIQESLAAQFAADDESINLVLRHIGKRIYAKKETKSDGPEPCVPIQSRE